MGTFMLRLARQAESSALVLAEVEGRSRRAPVKWITVVFLAVLSGLYFFFLNALLSAREC